MGRTFNYTQSKFFVKRSTKLFNISLFELINFRIGNHLIYTSVPDLSSAFETFFKINFETNILDENKRLA